jgi:hypothetical protein
MKLVSDWRKAWKWHSTWIAGVMAALPLAWANMPSDLKQHIPDSWMPWIAVLMFVAFMAGRLRDQGS